MEEQIQKLIYPELSYTLVGILFHIQNKLGKGYKEKHVQRAVALALQERDISYKEQVMSKIEFGNKVIGRYYLDFLIDGIIALELKVGEKLTTQDFTQVKDYLAKTGLALGLIACFSRNGVKIYRVLKPYNTN